MKEYKIICSRHANEISDRATALLNEGWEPYGSPLTPAFTDEDRIMSFAYAQAFVREAKDV